MAWKLALSGKLVALNTLMAAALLWLLVELARTDSGRTVVAFFLLPAIAIGVIDVVFMVLHVLWSAVFGRKTHTAA